METPEISATPESLETPDLPAARLAHWAPPRARLRIDSRRRDAAYFEALADELDRCPAVGAFAVNPLTASLLLNLSAPLAAVDGWARERGLFALAPLSEDEESLDRLLRDALALAGLSPRRAGGAPTLDALIVLSLLAAAVFQFRRGNVLPAAATLLWSALDRGRSMGREAGRRAAAQRMADALQWKPAAP